MASVSALKEILGPTSLPDGLVEEMLSETNTLWLLGVSDEVVAGELVLCHPALAEGEVRAVVQESEVPGRWSVTVVASDRPGLLASTTATLASEGLSIEEISATVLQRSRLALQRISVCSAGAGPLDDRFWERLGGRLRAGPTSAVRPSGAFVPRGPVAVEVQPQTFGRSLVTIDAPDQVGLLHAVASWFEAVGCNLEACRGGSEAGLASDVFLVAGDFDPELLAESLDAGPGEFRPTSLAGSLVSRLFSLGTALLKASLRAPFRAAKAFLAQRW